MVRGRRKLQGLDVLGATVRTAMDEATHHGATHRRHLEEQAASTRRLAIIVGVEGICGHCRRIAQEREPLICCGHDSAIHLDSYL